MSDFNQVGVLGRLTRDAELKYTTGSGTAVLNFSIACNRSIPPKDGGEWKNEASFFDCQAWGKLAEQKAKILVKGKQVLVAGELRQDRWEQDGQARSRIYIVAESIQTLADPRKEGQGEAGGASGASAEGRRPPDAPAAQDSRPAKDSGLLKDKPGDDFTDDIPF